MIKKIFCITLLSFLLVLLVVIQFGYATESIDKVTENNAFQIRLNPPGDGFVVGINYLTLKISDPDGRAVTGAIISIKPWMPGMGHGVVLTPTIKEEGNGNYFAENVGFSMPGLWQLIVTVKDESREDKAIFELPNVGKVTLD